MLSTITKLKNRIALSSVENQLAYSNKAARAKNTTPVPLKTNNPCSSLDSQYFRLNCLNCTSMRLKLLIVFVFALSLFVKPVIAVQHSLIQLNASVEELVSNKEYTKAIQFCNAELQKSNTTDITRFLIVTKCRLFAKSRKHIDSIPILFKSQQEFYNNSTDSAHLFLNARSLEILGHYYYLTRNVDSAIETLERADSAYALSNSYTSRIYNLNMLGTIFHHQENFSRALFCQLLALDLLNEFTPNDTNSRVNLKIDVGLVYFKLERYDKALEQYSDVMKTKLSPVQKAQVLNNLGIIFIEQKRFDLAIAHLESALVLYKELDMPKDISLIYNNLASALEAMDGNSDTIFTYFKKSLQLKKTYLDTTGMVTTYLNIASFLIERDFLKLANIYLDSAWTFKSHFNAQDIANAFYYKMQLARMNNDFVSALSFYETYHTYQDSANELKNIWQLKKAETEIELSKQQQEIELLKKERQIKEIANSRRSIMTYAGIGVLLITIILLSSIAYYFFKKQRFEHKIRSREVKLASITNLVKGQEDERLRMAKELHDGVGNNLAILNAEITRDFSKENKNAIISLLSQTSEEVRNITHDLMPITVKKLGLNEAINDLVDKWRHSSNLVIDVNTSNEELGLDKNEELTIYRIIQELIKNSVQHGEATYILLNIKKEKGQIHLQFEDNGHGLRDEVEASKGIGFKNISSRVAYLNGTFDMESDENGVRIKFVFSIPRHENSNR